MPIREELSGRVALVTGGGRGIGRACCLRLAESGIHVALNYARNRQAAEDTANSLAELGVKTLVAQADVADESQVTALVGQIESQLGPIDLLINNAGVFDFVSHEDTTRELWDRTLATNLTGTYQVTFAVKDGMCRRKFGRIVNIASIAGLRARPMSIAYAASKAGVIGLTKSLAEALAPFDVRVNAVAPGLIATEIIDGVTPETKQKLVDATPLGRIGSPEEIADVALFLLSDESRFMTGQTLVASGGRVHLP